MNLFMEITCESRVALVSDMINLIGLISKYRSLMHKMYLEVIYLY